MEKLKAFYRESLIETLKECSKTAASSLNTLINNTVYANLTSINLRPFDEMFMLPADDIVIVSDISGNLSGTMIVAFRADEGMRIVNRMLGRDINLIKDLEEEEISVLREYINIVGGRYLSTLGDHFNLQLRPEIPSFEGRFSEIQKMMVDQLKAMNKRVLFINSSMNVPDLKADAVFYILFDEDSLMMLINLISKGLDDQPFENV